MRRVSWYFGASVGLLLVGCGGEEGTPSGDAGADVPPPWIERDSSSPTCTGPNVCACADRGPPNFNFEAAGMASPSSTEAQLQALVRANHWRTASGLPPLNAHEKIEAAAEGHSRFMASNPSSCWPGAHNQSTTATCEGFTGADVGARLRREMYSWQTWGEVINWNPTPTASIDGWIWTVYHRQPFTSNAFTETGFGTVRTVAGSGSPYQVNNTMDFARPPGMSAHEQRGVVYFPPPGTIDVPRAFQGNLEGPTPPVPLTTRRWPSGTVISVNFPSANHTITVHRLYDSDCNPVVHSYFAGRVAAEESGSEITVDPVLSSRNDTRFQFMYADTALNPSTDYYVELEGTVDGEPWRKVWMFRTAIR